jgi:GNAT superfamily N-acetyltransferase
MNPDFKILEMTPSTLGKYGVCGYKNVDKHEELRNKINWYAKYYPLGLRIQSLISGKDECLGMIEYMPGEIAHRPVLAHGYMFIQCIFLGFKKEFKGKGLGTKLIEKCIEDAKISNKYGLAVVTRKGSFMADKNLFLKMGFIFADKAVPDFELLVLKFDLTAPDPAFRNTDNALDKYQDGLYILRSPQCPYTMKNVKSIVDLAKKKYNLKTIIVEQLDIENVQNSPCPFGSFSIIYKGKIISNHPISVTRFENIIRAVQLKSYML